MVLFVNALGGQASFTISLAALTPVSGVSWTYTGLPATAGTGVSFTSSDDSGITFTAFAGFINNLSSMTVRATLENSTTAAATFDISSGSGAILPAINSLVELGVTNGLVAQYDPPSWNGTTHVWIDKSGNGNNTSPADVRGVITYDTTNGFLYGGPSDGLKFPALGTTANYTFIHLARYKDGARQRIFQGVTENWASGFYDGKSGVAFHNGYITAPTDLYGYNWVISSDQRNLYRAHSVNFTSGTAGSPGYPTRIGLNFGAATSEYSDWAVAEVLIYNRVLTATEMLSVENYLRAKYPSLTIQIDTTIGASFTIPQSNYTLSVGSVNWTYKTPLPAGVTFTGSTQIGAAFSIATGTFINNQNMVVNASGNGGGGTRSLYLLAASRALLDTPNVTFDTSDPGSFTVLQTASGTGGVTWAYTNLPASVTFLSSSDAGLTFQVAQNAVVPTRTLTVTATNGLKTPTFASFTYGSGVKPVLAVGAVNAIDSTSSSTFFIPQTVIDAFTGGITWSYYPPVFPAGLTVSATNQGATFTVAQNAVIAQQTITVTATNIGGVATPISFIVGAAVKPVLGFTNQLLNTSTALKQFTVTIQAPSVTYSGGITWSYTLPTGLTFVTSSPGLITFQAARGVIITSQTFVVTATNSVGTPTAASFTLGAGTPPVLIDPTNGTGELIIDTGLINKPLEVEQEKRNTGTITWTVSPSSYPAGMSIQPPITDFAIVFILLSGTVLPYQPFTFTATAASGFVATRTFNVGASSLVSLQGPGDPKLIDTTTQQTLKVKQNYDPTYTGPITWTITPSSYPAGISITTQNDYETIFTFNANSYLTRQPFVISAQTIGGFTDTIQFDVGSAVRPTLANLANQVLNTSTVPQPFAVAQQVNQAYTGPIAWTVTPSPFPSGSGITQVATNQLITFTVPAQTASTGVVWPTTPFSVTATNINTGYSSFVPTTFNVFAPRLPFVDPITPSSRILNVLGAAYTLITATQSKSDAVPVVWSITKSDNTAVPAGVSINSSGLVTIAMASYFTATVLKAIATNSAGAFGSTTFTVTTPAPPVINTVTPSSPQILNVTAGQQQLTFALTNTALAGNIAWTLFFPDVPIPGVTLTVGGVLTIVQDTYFASTTFTIRATNTDTGVYNERPIVINTPQTPVINTVAPVSPQILNVTSTSKKFTFTNAVTLARPVDWSLTTNPESGAVSINSTTGEVTVSAFQYFLSSTFVVQASNAAINVANTRSFVINTPAPPAFTATYASPVFVNTSATAASLPFTSTEARADPVAWSLTQGDDSLVPPGVSINSGGTVEIAQGTSFMGLELKVMASNAAIASTTSLTNYFVNAPAAPVLNTTLTIPTPTYKPIVAYGVVTSVTNLNSAGTSIPGQANQTYTSVASTNVSGAGSGATFTVVRNGSGAVTLGNISVAFYGLGYATGNTVKLLGTALGGTTPTNDVTITVAATTSVYMNNSTASNVIQVSQTASPTGTITWGGVSSLPTGVNVTETPSLLSVNVTTSAVLRPKLALTVSATGPSLQGLPGGLVSGNVVFDIFTPLIPIIGTPADNANFSFDTVSSAHSITVAQDATQLTADTGPIRWDFVSPTYGDVTQTLNLAVVFAPRSLIITVPMGIYITGDTASSYVPITVRAINPANMISTANKTFNLYVPEPPVWVANKSDGTPITAPVTFNTSDATPVTFTVTQTTSTTPINYDGITYTAPSPASPISLTTGTATITQSGDVYTVTLSQGAVTASQSITFSATNSTNGMNRTVSRTVTFTCSVPPVILATTSWTPAADPVDVYTLDTQTAAITIDAKYTSSLPLTTITTDTLPVGVTFAPGSATSTQSTFTIAQEANIPSGSITLSLGTSATGTNYTTKTFTVKAAAQPTLGAPSQSGTLNTTSSSQTITITAASSPISNVTVWDIDIVLPTGVTGSGVTGITSSGTVVYTITIPQLTSFASVSPTITAKTGVSTIKRAVTFSFSALVYNVPIVTAIGNFLNLNTTSGSTFVTASISNAGNTSGLAGPNIVYTISPDSVGVSINSSSGAISIATSTIFTTTTFTVTATGQRGSGTTTFQAKANIAPALTLVTSSLFNVNTYSSGQALVQLSQTSGGTEIVWSMSASPAFGRYPNVNATTGGGSFAPFIDVQNNTFCEVEFPQGAIYDGGTQGTIATITVTATNSAGSVTITTTGYAYPYIIYNWTSLIGPENWFGMFFPNKATNNSKKYSLYYVDGAGRLGVGSASNNQNLRYDYTTRRITYQGSGNVLRGYQNQRTTFENNTGNESMWVYVFPESGQTTLGWWYELGDGTGWRLNGGLNNGGDTQMYQQGDGDGNAQIQNVI